MTLTRIALIVLALAIAPSATVHAQSDPLQEANQLFRQGQFDRAMERVNGYLASRPKDAKGRFLKGVILSEQNRPNDAIKVFTELTQDYPELPEPYNNLAVLYASQGQYEKARNALETAIRTHPSYATAHENLGDIYAKMASQAYDQAFRLDRNNQAAQGKLNLIKDLFSQTSIAGRTQQPKTAVAKAEPPAPAAPAPVAPQPSVKPPPPPVSVAATPPTPPAAPAPAQKAAPSTPAPDTGPSKAPTVVATAPASAPPAATSAPQKTAASGNNEDVVRSVNSWARAWSSNDVPGYLSHYSPDFQTPKGMSRRAWESERKSRIAKPRKIEVQVDSPKVRFEDNNRAVVSFRQHYKSGALDVTGGKTLVMIKHGDKWLIQQEHSGS
jgi:tetratricopeptide (TPR) repeat protein/ketosteroid isomerase-like protein